MVGLVIIGDLEGDRDRAVGRLRALGERGDLRFGMGPQHREYLAAIESVCAEVDLRLLCINGDHEDWARLDELWADPRRQDADGRLRPLEVCEHVTLLPRGHRWELGGRSFVALGGAPAVNRELLTEGVDWWPSEVIREERGRGVRARAVGTWALRVEINPRFVCGSTAIARQWWPTDRDQSRRTV